MEASSTSDISIKIQHFGLGGARSIHRFRGSFDFEGLVAAVAALLGVPAATVALALSYVDPDGDEVSLRTPLEWNECCRLHDEQHGAAAATKALLLTVRTSGAPATPTPQPAVAAPTPVVPASTPSRTTENAAPPPLPVVRPEPVPPPVAAPPVAAPPLPDDFTRMHDELVRLTHQLCGGDTPGVERVLSCSRAAMALGAHDAAEGLLETALSVHCGHASLEYNLAAAAAASGSTDRAFHFLNQAVKHGFADGLAMQNDSAFAALHGDARFHDLAKRLGCEIAVGRALMQPGVATMISVFPSMTARRAEEALASYGGDVDRAIAAILRLS